MIIRKVYLLVTLILASTGNAFSTIHSGSCGENATYSYDTDTKELTISGKGRMDDYPISHHSPWDNFSIKKLTIEPGITYIGERCFMNQTNMTSVRLPDGLSVIGSSAFYSCGFTEIDIPASVTEIGEHAFQVCRSLKSVKLHEGLTTINKYAFDLCDALESIDLPESVVSIGDWAFASCYALKSIRLPSGIQNLGSMVFADMYNLDTPIFNDRIFAQHPIVHTGVCCVPDGITEVAEGAFNRCGMLEVIAIPRSVKKIGSTDSWTFGGNQSLHTIYWDAEDCQCNFGDLTLTHMVLGDNVKRINSTGNISWLKSVTSYAKVPPTIGKGLFTTMPSGCTLYVPAGSVESYRADQAWNRHFTIRPIEESREELTERLSEVYLRCKATSFQPGTGFGSYRAPYVDEFKKALVKAAMTVRTASACTDYQIRLATAALDMTYDNVVNNQYIIEDGTPLPNLVPGNYEYLRYNHRFSQYWEPIFLPFSMDYAELNDEYYVAEPVIAKDKIGSSQYDMSPELMLDFRLVDGGTLRANHPYMIRCKKPGLGFKSILVHNACVQPSTEPCVQKTDSWTYTFHGTYVPLKSDEITYSGSLLLLEETGNPFAAAWLRSPGLETKTLMPMQWYLTAQAETTTPHTHWYVILVDVPYEKQKLQDSPTIVKGNTFELQGFSYKISDADPSGDRYCTLTASTLKNSSEIVIPERVEIRTEFTEDGELYRGLCTYPVREIGAKAFSNAAVKRVTLPSSLTAIGDNAFERCRNLEAIDLPEGLEHISQWAFFDDSKLKEIRFPASLQSIGENAFKGCQGLTSIKIPAAVGEIGENTFYACNNLEDISVDADNQAFTSYGSSNIIVRKANHKLFLGCRNSIIPEGVETVGAYALKCGDMRELKLPSTLKTIESYAITACDSIKSIHIPASVEFIGTWNFTNLNALKITVDEQNPWYDSRNNCNAIIRTDKDRLILGCAATIIPEGIRAIGEQAFYCCKDLKTISIPATVTDFEPFAFNDCPDLTDVYYFSETPKRIPESAFGPVKYNLPGALSYAAYPQTLHVKKGLRDTYMQLGGWSMFYIIREDADDPSDVPVVNGINGLSAPIYDLQGRQLQQKPSKGMYIQGGKKVLVK